MSKDYNNSINPDHYTKGIDVQEFNFSHNRNHLAGTCIKYLVRYDVKNPVDPLEDLYKCKQCLEKLITLTESNKQSFIEKVQGVINDDHKKNYNSYKKGLDAN
jgi:hypothetical protein|tara:strand:+ start:147 stop:455 length:309 start_codon:yes stop_codon:yes gene_type:complete